MSLQADFRPIATAAANLAPKAALDDDDARAPPTRPTTPPARRRPRRRHPLAPPYGLPFPPQALEREFWKKVCYSPPLSAADIEGSLFDADCPWNVARLDTMLSRTLASAGASIPGVTSPYLYFGMWRALFAWHTEDLDLYSVNYLHFGAPKTWYTVPPEHRKRFEIVAQGLCPELFRTCPEFFRHKEILLSPQLLRQQGIPLVRVVQREREFVVTYPGAYHAGFNHGYNCAESTNFATQAWVDVGACARSCYCCGDAVHIDMRIFGVEVSSSEEDSSDEEEDLGDPAKAAAAAAAAAAAGAGTGAKKRGRPPGGGRGRPPGPGPGRWGWGRARCCPGASRPPALG